MEGLTTIINRACANLVIHGNKICRAAQTDDSLLFCRATPEECTALRNLLDDYEKASDQVINYAKSSMYFSKNVNEDRRIEIKNIMGVQN